jgi:hypothetical protein
MTMPTRWTLGAAALPLVALLALPEAPLTARPASSLTASDTSIPAPYAELIREARAKSTASGHHKQTPPPPAATTAQPELPPRIPYTAAQAARATIPGMPDARFWADAQEDFKNALPAEPGPWLILSSGGADGAFGAGLLTGLSAAGKRPDYTVVTGVSTGALMAPFIFAGSRYDDALREVYTKVTAADIFEAGRTGESFADSWPLRDLIAKQITPEVLSDIAAEHRRGRRLFVVSTDLDSERFAVWNMGAIAAHGGDDALKLFRSVLLASASIPGAFPPVLIDVEADGKRFQEMHVDGGLGGQFFVAPPALMASTSDYRLPATGLWIVVNTGLQRDFKVVDRFAPNILSQAVGAAVKVDTRLMLDRALVVAKRSSATFNVATIPESFRMPSKGPFDPRYMSALFQTGYDLGRSDNPFSTTLPPEPGAAVETDSTEKTGASQ